ncbi:unnamed protein product [Adineta ricciae]|uniref:EGF-like domain-containing protein n=1 Tax=Adineta ricciae TaxID=249248 RepID=A0A815V4P9_ADIRI|nr:unnamed protein product [Adineta ricciae]
MCVCPLRFFGDRCQEENLRVEIILGKKLIRDATLVFAHFITIHQDKQPTSISVLPIIPFDQTNVVFHTSIEFHLLFGQVYQNYYLIYLRQSKEELFNKIVIDLIPSSRCLYIRELLPDEIVNFHPLRCAKHYHTPYREDSNLTCFHDLETFMCLGNNHHRANCFNFHFNSKYDCQGNNSCLNDAQCFQDLPQWPTMTVCVCAECFYGKLCQFSMETIRLSLDPILTYHIRPRLSFSRQSTAIKITAGLILFMYVCGVLSGLLFMVTFCTKTSRKCSIGVYLLFLSFINLLLIHMLALKFIFLLLIQMQIIHQQWILQGNCLFGDFILRTLLNIDYWLNACIAIERTLNFAMGLKFNQIKSQRICKWIIVINVIVNILTRLTNPFHRNVIEDKDNERTWCIINYDSHLKLQQFDSILIVINYLCPFVIHLLSSIIIILLVARSRSTANREKFSKQVRRQINQHYHLIISPFILVILALPRLIIPLIYRYIKSTNDPWPALAGYFVSFIPPILTFFIFVLPSQTYKQYL